MKSHLFCILDSVAGVFMAPFVARSRVDAIRQISGSKASPDIANTPIAAKPHEFVLYEIGTFDDESGVISPHQMPDRVDSVGSIWAVSSPSTVAP